MGNGMICVFRKCKCGNDVMCRIEQEIQDGDLIDHNGCKLKDVQAHESEGDKK